jgi:hypothetical protein
MTSLDQARLLFHGAVVAFFSMLCGIPLFLAMQHGWGDKVIQFWRSAHVGLATVGVWSIATGAALGHLVLEERDTSVLAWSIIVSNYAISIAILVRGLATPLGLDVAAPPLRLLVMGGRDVSAIAGFVAAIVTIRGGSAAVRAAKTHRRLAASVPV